MSIQSINPTTGQSLEHFDYMTPQRIDQLMSRSVTAQKEWQLTPIAERARLMNRVADLLEERADELGRIAVLEMGKVIGEGIGEVKKCAWVCRHYAEHTAAYLEPTLIETDASRSFVRYDPLGVVLAIMPWNFPFWQVFRFIAPNLMSGNGGLLKHAPNVPRCALAIEQIMIDAGFPQDLFRTLMVDVDSIPKIIADDRVAAVTLTGSERAGRAVGEATGKAIKPMVLELGGADAFMVLDGADVEKAAEVGLFSRCLNNGQSCIAAKRFIVIESLYDSFVLALKNRMAALTMGDPLEESTHIGPMARADLRDDLHQQVQALVAEGADCVLGGSIPEGLGYFYPPTLLIDIQSKSQTAREETFGPVATVFKVRDVEEAIELANDTPFGLGASLWTDDAAVIDQAVPRIQAGAVFVNGMVKSDPRLPFGGIKASGVGRELGAEGVLAFLNTKTVWIA